MKNFLLWLSFFTGLGLLATGCASKPLTLAECEEQELKAQKSRGVRYVRSCRRFPQ